MEKARIMIVEDEAIVAKDLEKLLSDFGYKVVESVVSANDAIQQAIEHNPDLIIMDIILKGKKNGIEAASEIKDKLGIPIIFITAYSDFKLIEEAKNIEPYAFIIKPFQERQLLASIEMALNKSRIEKKLLESENMYRTLIDNIQDGLFLIQDRKLKYVNEAFARISGYTVDEIIGMDFKDLVAPEDLDMVVDRYIKMMKGEKVPNDYEFHGIQKNQTIRTTVYMVCSLIKYQGKTAVLGTLKDITEHKQTQEDLRIEQDYSRKIVAGSPSIICGIAQDGTTTFINPTGEHITGYSAGELIGQNWWHLFYPEDEYKQVEELFKEIENGDICDYEMGLTTRDGKKRVILWSSLNMYDESHRLVEIIGFGNDITERKQLEEQMQQINEELEERVIERTTELKHTYEQLYHAQKMESVGILAGGIAHDFNNLLTVVIGNLSLARKDIDPEDKIFNVFLEAEEASLRAKDLTHKLLTFSKGGEPIKKIISIAKLIKESVNFAIRGSNVKCKFEIPDNLRNIDADEVQITQAISNIIINADQAMPVGGMIRVWCENVTIPRKNENTILPDNEEFVKISIEDHGTGILKEHISSIFDPFFTTKKKGSGLGLATAYSIINKHGGQITVESAVGTGSTFYIYLPAAQEEVSPKAAVDVIEKPPASSGEKILVMDDDENIRFLLKEILTTYGYVTESACDGAQAIELYKKAQESGNPFDLVILDLTIPGGMGGKETIEELVKIDPDVSGIVSSGYSNDAIMANYKNYGFKGVISKPYMPDDLVRIVQDVFNSPKYY